MTTTERALISVIVPSYNYGRYVRECIASVAAQTYPRVELIVVDDGSRDDSVAIIERVLSDVGGSLERCAIHRQRHRGPAVALTRAVRMAEGDFVSVLPSDDRFLPEKLELLAGRPEWSSPDTAAVFADVAFIDESGTRINVDVSLSADPTRTTGFACERELYLAAMGQPPWDELGTYGSLITGSYIPFAGALIRRSALAASPVFDGRFVTPDYAMWLTLSRTGTLVPVDTVVAEKRWHEKSTTLGQRRRMVCDYATLIVRERRHCEEQPLLDLWRAAFARAVHGVLTVAGRTSLASLFRAGNPIVTARELALVVRSSRRARHSAHVPKHH